MRPGPDTEALSRQRWALSPCQKPPGLSAVSLCAGRYLLEKAAVAVVPGSAFGAPNCIRISYAASEQVLQAAMQRMGDAIAQIQTLQ